MIDFRLCLVTDRTCCRPPASANADARQLLRQAVASACGAGVRAVQVREKDLEAGDLFDLTRDLRDVTAKYACRLLVNDRVDVALAAEADGVHCPEEGFPAREARDILGARAVIGVSGHSLEAIERAERAGANFAFYGPVFATRSKSAPAGLDALREVCARVRIPVFAIGGVTPERAIRCREAGASGVGAVSALLDVDDVAAAVRAFAEAMGEL